MGDPSSPATDLASRRPQPVQTNRVRSTNPFVAFKRNEIEQSLQHRFEQQVRRYLDRLAVKTRSHEFTYEVLNRAANRVAHLIFARRARAEEPVALLLNRVRR